MEHYNVCKTTLCICELLCVYEEMSNALRVLVYSIGVIASVI